jgi:hypothetical protein
MEKTIDERPPVVIDVGLTDLVRWRVGQCAKDFKVTPDKFIVGALEIATETAAEIGDATLASSVSETTRVELPADLAAALSEQAASIGVSLEEYARRCIETDHALIERLPE